MFEALSRFTRGRSPQPTADAGAGARRSADARDNPPAVGSQRRSDDPLEQNLLEERRSPSPWQPVWPDLASTSSIWSVS